MTLSGDSPGKGIAVDGNLFFLLRALLGEGLADAHIRHSLTPLRCLSSEGPFGHHMQAMGVPPTKQVRQGQGLMSEWTRDVWPKEGTSLVSLLCV